MISLVQTGGPMWNQPLSDMRSAALIAVDTSEQLPAPVTAYILALERNYLSMREQRNSEFLRETWEARTISDLKEPPHG